MIPDEIIEQVRESADLVGIIGESVDLKRTGSDYRGPCPFHGGSHRNFAVIPKKGRYYCFVCKESGDIFSYFMKRFGMDYPTAVREVAQRMGIIIPEQTQRTGPDPREPLYSAVAVAHDWFARQLSELPEAETARTYLQGRGVDMDTAGSLALGFAPRGSALLEAMGKLGLKEPLLLEVGLLAQRDDGSVIPRFRGRLLFPIHDLRGRVVGFGGRLLGPGEPKYLNSPETPIFHKGGQLYNLHQARSAIRKEEAVILVEGYFDVLRLVLAGFENVVAPLGTAVTPDQAALLRRFAGQAILLFDSDQAGLKATFRAGDELLRHEMRVRVATLPEGEDPDTLVQRGGSAALSAVLNDAVDVMERKIQILERKGWFSGIEHRREALDRLLPTIRAAKDPITRELYLSLAAERAGIDKKVLEQEAAQAPLSANPKPMPSGFIRPTPAALRQRRPTVDRKFLTYLVHNAEIRSRAGSIVRREWLDSAVARELFDRLIGSGHDQPASPTDGLSPAILQAWNELLAEAPYLSSTEQEKEFDALCLNLEARPYRRQLAALDRAKQEASDPAAAMSERRVVLEAFRQKFPSEYARWIQARGSSRSARSGSPPPGSRS